MTSPRLSDALWPSLHGLVSPAYDRLKIGPGIVHIGVGGFHRAHQAVYTDDVLNAHGGNWGIVGASLRSHTAASQLLPQDGLYTVNTLAPGQVQRRVIGAIQNVLTLTEPSAYAQFLATLADPNIHVMTLTVTEKGYCQNQTGLDTTHADVQTDLQQPAHCVSLPGVLCAGLRARQQANAGPVTLISCDNLSGNGDVLAAVVGEFATLTDPSLSSWIASNVSFPNTMVDRIVPATTNHARAEFAKSNGFVDEAMVNCEPFKQWVIEDRFVGPRPAWEAVGAFVVADVAPYESAKLRLLNGPHSACAYLGLLTGYQHIHQVMQDTELSQFVRRLVADEIQPTVTPPPNLDLRDYTTSIFNRFANSAIAYGTRQVGTDGSQKLPQRLVPVVHERLQAGQPIERLALVFAAWLAHLVEPAPDPLANQLQHLYSAHPQPEHLIGAISQETSILQGLGGYVDQFTDAVEPKLSQIKRNGLAAALKQVA